MSLVAEIQSLLLHNERMVKNSLVNGQDVLAEEPYKEQLYPSEEKDAYNERRDTRPEPVPVDQLHNEVHDRNKEAGRTDTKSQERCQTHHDLGVGSDPDHGKIIEVVEMVLALARPPVGPHIENRLVLPAELRDHAAEIRHRIVDLPHHADKGLVEETEAVKFSMWPISVIVRRNL